MLCVREFINRDRQGGRTCIDSISINFIEKVSNGQVKPLNDTSIRCNSLYHGYKKRFHLLSLIYTSMSLQRKSIRVPLCLAH